MARKPKQPHFIPIMLISLIIGTLFWALVFEIFAPELADKFSIGPIGVDLFVIACSLRINPGSFLGLVGGALLYKSL